MADRSRKPSSAQKISRNAVLQAARRHFIEGETQAAIAEDLGITAGYLARLLKGAREQGWVKIIVDSDRETELAAALMARYPHLVHCEVVPSGPTPEATARAIGTAMSMWFDDLLDRDEESGDPQIWKVAIGGAWPHQVLVDQVVRRKNRISVAPTALTPNPAKIERYTAPVVAAKLADRLGALSPANASGQEGERRGFLYSPTFRPPIGSLDELRTFFAEIENDPDYQVMLDFWRDTDVVFASVSSVRADGGYGDMRNRLASIGLSAQPLIDRGAVAVMSNRFLNADGDDVPLAVGMPPSYEVVIPTDAIRGAISGDRRGASRRGFVVLDAWGELEPRAPLAAVTNANVFFADGLMATKLVSLSPPARG
ncbi:MAG: hypothetical protein HUU33_14020 [Flavobacteriales bacterium]|nr:hypothetical protein [Flavobacteriales bacterium]